MSDKDFLRLEIKLLILRYGRKAVIESLSTFEYGTIEELEKEIELSKPKAKAKLPRTEKSPEEILNAVNISDDFRRIVLSLVEKFRSKIFLPNLRDAIAFLQSEGVFKRNVKSRQIALPLIVEALARMSKSRLQTIYKELSTYGDQSDFTILANKLMGKPRRDE